MGFAKALVNLREKRRAGKRGEVQASHDREIKEASLTSNQRTNLAHDRKKKKLGTLYNMKA